MIRKFLEKHKGFRLRLVGHSLGGATASLLAIMLRNRSVGEMGFSPELIIVVAYATPAGVSKELAESCYDFVTTVVMHGDILTRLSVASLTRLRNEIVEIDWENAFTREDWKGVLDLVSNVKQVVSYVKVVARKLDEYAKFNGQTKNFEMPKKKEVHVVTGFGPISSDLVKPGSTVDEELFIPNTLNYLKRNLDVESHHKAIEYYTLLRRQAGEHFQRNMLPSNLISDHRCDTHYYALGDVLEEIFGNTISCSDSSNILLHYFGDGSIMVRDVCYYHRGFFENLNPRGRRLVDPGGKCHDLDRQAQFGDRSSIEVVCCEEKVHKM